MKVVSARHIARWLGGLTAFTVVFYSVLLWPQSPSWTLEGARGERKYTYELLGVSDDDESLFVHEKEAQAGPDGQSGFIVIRSAADGHELSRFPAPADEAGYFTRSFFITPDRKLLVVVSEEYGPGRSTPKEGEPHRVHRIEVRDAQGGKRLRGPFYAEAFTVYKISPDGRWIACSTTTVPQCLFVLDVTSGKSLLRLPYDPATLRRDSLCCFSPDSQQLAVIRLEYLQPPAVDIYELPSTRHRSRWELPTQSGERWCGLKDWVGGEVRAIAVRPDEWARRYEYPTYGFEVTLKGQGIPRVVPYAAEVDDPRATEVTVDSGRRVVTETCYMAPGQSDWWERVLGEADRLLGTTWSSGAGRVRVRIQSKETGREIFRRFVAPDHLVSRRGQWIAQLKERAELEVWMTDRPQRWPWALGVGSVTAACVVGLRRRKPHTSQEG